MRYLALALAVVLAVALGVAGVIAGEADDSPGLQGLGVLLVLGALFLGVRAVRRSRSEADRGQL
jgi:drug/metabolite transporter (DMT)-like permease